jgi:hypothetical protein
MEAAKAIEVTAKRTKVAGPQGNGQPITLLISLDSPRSSSPILLYFFNSLGDIPFLQLRALPDGAEWEPGQPYFVAYSQRDLDYFYDDGDGALYLRVGDGMPPVNIVYVWVFEEDPGTANVSYDINEEVNSSGTSAAAQYNR